MVAPAQSGDVLDSVALLLVQSIPIANPLSGLEFMSSQEDP